MKVSIHRTFTQEMKQFITFQATIIYAACSCLHFPPDKMRILVAVLVKTTHQGVRSKGVVVDKRLTSHDRGLPCLP